MEKGSNEDKVWTVGTCRYLIPDASSSFAISAFLCMSWAIPRPSHLMASFWHLAKGLVKEPDSQQICFSNSSFKALLSDQKIEEGGHNAISKGRYYPVRVGDTIKSNTKSLGNQDMALDLRSG